MLTCPGTGGFHASGLQITNQAADHAPGLDRESLNGFKLLFTDILFATRNIELRSNFAN
jgi:hypothetical protein